MLEKEEYLYTTNLTALSLGNRQTGYFCPNGFIQLL